MTGVVLMNVVYVYCYSLVKERLTADYLLYQQKVSETGRSLEKPISP